MSATNLTPPINPFRPGAGQQPIYLAGRTEEQDVFRQPRWSRATDRQQQFMKVIATLSTSDEEFSVPEIVKASKELLKSGFNPSHGIQILQALAERGLIYRNRRGLYCFAVPLLARFIRRQQWDKDSLKASSPNA